MGDYFKVGERYNNRIGEYEVLEVKTPMVLIRYTESGRLREVEEELQERIVRNLLREIEIAERPPEERKTPTRTSRPRRKRAKFPGFTQADFQDKITGTSWRAKTGLAGVLAQVLSERVREPFDSWAPNRQTACYVARPEECAADFLDETAQFFVLTAPEGLTYGLQVKRPAESDETTAWDHLVSALGEDENLAEALDDLLRSDEVSLSWFGETKGAAGAETIRAQEDGLAMDRGAVTESDSIEGLLARLEEAPDDQNLTLSVENNLTVGEAIAAGSDINDTVVDLFEKLIGLYRACAG